jgi:hypothetical protein
VNTGNEATLSDLYTELTSLEAEISRLRLVGERATYKLEQAVREHDRVGRHICVLSEAKEEA